MSVPASPALAHGGAAHVSNRGPSPGAVAISTRGVVSDVVIEDATGATLARYKILTTSSNQRYVLDRRAADALPAGASVEVDGRQDHGIIFTSSIHVTAAAASRALAAKRGAAQQIEGDLRLGHADNFDGAPSEFFYAIIGAQGHTRIELGTAFDVLRNGMRVRAEGEFAASGEFAAERIVVLEKAEDAKAAVVLKAAPVTASVLVLPIKFPTNTAAPFTYASDPFTIASLQTAVFTGTGTSSVASYYNEVSYGQQLLGGVVASSGGAWLLANQAVPTTCDINVIATAAETAATAAGYNLNSYSNIVYVFSSNVPGCGWSGLAYVGWGRAWIKQTTSTLVIGHELGHNFGLLHAASVDCGSVPVGGTCSSAEYGDPFAIMGNINAMHFNAAQKSQLGWLAPSTVKLANTGTGTATFTLSPLETGGGTTYAVKIPAYANRTFWLEYRQPIGFDNKTAPYVFNGALVHVQAPFESICSGCADDTELVDMTPATATFADAALPLGQTYLDASGVSFSVLSQGAGALTVSVTARAKPSFSDVPLANAAFTGVEALVYNHITVGCTGGPSPLYCPTMPVTRAQIAAFIERAERGINYPFTATGTVFTDVAVGSGLAGEVEQFYKDGIGTACSTSPLKFCPDASLTRAEMSIFLLRGRHGSTYTPPAATGTMFTDVPTSYWAAAWIEQLYREGVTVGCSTSPLKFCPDSNVDRGSMALFIQRTYNFLSPP